MKKDETKLNGVEVPDWYIKLEPRIIELTNLKEKIENELGELRTTVLSMMKAEGITNVTSEPWSTNSILKNSKKTMQTCTKDIVLSIIAQNQWLSRWFVERKRRLSNASLLLYSGR